RHDAREDRGHRECHRDMPRASRVRSSGRPGAIVVEVSMSTKALIGILLAGAVGIVIFLFVHMSSNGDITVAPAHAAACTKGDGDCLPDVKYVDTTGKAYSPETLAGKVVVVNFWATWCHPCQKEIPDLSRAFEKYKSKGLVMLGVMTDQPTDAQ